MIDIKINNRAISLEDNKSDTNNQSDKKKMSFSEKFNNPDEEQRKQFRQRVYGIAILAGLGAIVVGSSINTGIKSAKVNNALSKNTPNSISETKDILDNAGVHSLRNVNSKTKNNIISSVIGSTKIKGTGMNINDLLKQNGIDKSDFTKYLKTVTFTKNKPGSSIIPEIGDIVKGKADSHGISGTDADTIIQTYKNWKYYNK